jgi:CTP synthase
VEIPTHPFFLGCQFHPEFKSKPLQPHPLFREFVGASYRNRLASKHSNEPTEHMEQIEQMGRSHGSSEPIAR